MKNLNENNFEEEVLKSDKPVIVDFYADWCMPCKIMAPVISQVEKEHIGEIVFGKLNIDENPMVALEYRVLSIPTLLFIKDGKVLGRIEEAVTKNVVDSKIKKYFENQ
jgi:thioredoxin 1